VNASEDDRIAVLQVVPDDVGKSPNDRTTVRSVSFGICKRVVTNMFEEFIDRFSELGSETRLLGFVPVLDSRRVELGRPTKQDTRTQSRGLTKSASFFQQVRAHAGSIRPSAASGVQAAPPEPRVATFYA